MGKVAVPVGEIGQSVAKGPRSDPRRADEENRVMPRTVNRAVTCFVEARRNLRKAMEALDVAIDIFDDVAPDAIPTTNAARRALVGDLSRLRGRLRGVEAELDRTWRASPWDD